MSLIELKSLGSGSDLWTDEGDYIYPDNAPAVVITDTGRLGINETAPETLVELTHTAPYIALHNSSAEDTAGGRESRIIVKGHQSGNEESTLGYLECGHDGSGDDQKAKWTLYGNDGTDDDAPTKRLLIDSNGHLYIYSPTTSDYVRLYHDDTNTYLRWNDGVLILQTDEGTNSVTDIQIRGKGSQSGRLRVYDEDDAEYLQFFMSLGRGYFKVTGAAPSVLMFQDTADVDITCFQNASEGETKEFKIYGYRTGDSLLSLEIGVGVDAADTASFDGPANYKFDGQIIGNLLQLLERSSNPDEPDEGGAVLWISDGTGYGDDGDFMIVGKAGGVARYGTLWDFSGGALFGVESQINTENRRRAASGFFMFLLSPVPDEDIDTADDRYHNAGLYRSYT
jgi:hypothetical protein